MGIGLAAVSVVKTHQHARYAAPQSAIKYRLGGIAGSAVLASNMDMRQISIRPLVVSDAQAVYETVRESIREISVWMDWARANYVNADAETWIRITQAGFEEGSRFEFGIFDLNDVCLGQIGIQHINKQAKYANLAYWVRTSMTGRGVAAAAVRLVAKWAFGNTDLQRLEIVVALGNRRSQRVAEKVGAIREGVLRSKMRVFDQFHDAIMYSIVRGDPI